MFAYTHMSKLRSKVAHVWFCSNLRIFSDYAGMIERKGYTHEDLGSGEFVLQGSESKAIVEQIVNETFVSIRCRSSVREATDSYLRLPHQTQTLPRRDHKRLKSNWRCYVGWNKDRKHDLVASMDWASISSETERLRQETIHTQAMTWKLLQDNALFGVSAQTLTYDLTREDKWGRKKGGARERRSSSSNNLTKDK